MGFLQVTLTCNLHIVMINYILVRKQNFRFVASQAITGCQKLNKLSVTLCFVVRMINSPFSLFCEMLIQDVNLRDASKYKFHKNQKHLTNKCHQQFKCLSWKMLILNNKFKTTLPQAIIFSLLVQLQSR